MKKLGLLSIASLGLAVLSCSQAQFDSSKQKRAEPRSENALRSSLNPNTPLNGNSVNCTDMTEQECHSEKVKQNSPNSHRIVDCANQDEQTCRTSIQNTKVIDGRENSKIIVNNCQDYCSKLATDPNVKIGDQNGNPDDGSNGRIVINGQEIVGQKVERVGVNFEDLFDKPANDRDYNDAVLCFTGGFIVNQAKVVSTKEQTVVGETFSASACDHTVTVDIKNLDGTTENTISFDTNAPTPINMTFHKGSVLEVSMQTTKGGCTKQKVSMHNTQAAVVKPDVCNNRGK